MPDPDLQSRELVLTGECIALFAFDVGNAIELERAAHNQREHSEARLLKHKRHAPDYFQFQPPPLSAREERVEIELEGERPKGSYEHWIYDFGGLSLSYRFPFQGTWEQWVELSCRLSDSQRLPADARARATALLSELGDAVSKPNLAAVIEDYAIFRLPAPEGRNRARAICDSNAEAVARILRAERSALSEEETQDALAGRVSFGPSDLALIDWNGALLFDDDPEDVIAVLAFANLHLLEVRFLDQQLDTALDEAYDALKRHERGRLRLPGAFERELSRVARLQADAAVLFERVSNALKLLNDQYLARVHRQASQRLRLAEWNQSILRKLDALDGIYQKMQDRADARRMEFLEWIIIVLIALSMILPFLPGYGH